MSPEVELAVMRASVLNAKTMGWAVVIAAFAMLVSNPKRFL